MLLPRCYTLLDAFSNGNEAVMKHLNCTVNNILQDRDPDRRKEDWTGKAKWLHFQYVTWYSEVLQLWSSGRLPEAQWP